jgi:tetratricopeptide (TPR) repeat protein
MISRWFSIRVLVVITCTLIIAIITPHFVLIFLDNLGMISVNNAILETQNRQGVFWWSPELLFDKDVCPFQPSEREKIFIDKWVIGSGSRGWLSFLQCDFDEAAEMFSNASSQRPSNRMLKYVLASVYQYDGHYKEAALVWRESHYKDYFINTGEQLLMDQNWDVAERLYNTVLVVWPDDGFGYDGMGRVWLYGRNQPQIALPFFVQATKITPQPNMNRVLLAQAYLAVGNNNAAKKEANIVLVNFPNNDLAHMILGEVARAEGDNLTALFEYQIAVEINPDNEWSLLGLGYAQAEIGNRDEAERLWHHILELHPNFQPACDALGILCH